MADGEWRGVFVVHPLALGHHCGCHLVVHLGNQNGRLIGHPMVVAVGGDAVSQAVHAFRGFGEIERLLDQGCRLVDTPAFGDTDFERVILIVQPIGDLRHLSFRPTHHRRTVDGTVFPVGHDAIVESMEAQREFHHVGKIQFENLRGLRADTDGNGGALGEVVIKPVFENLCPHGREA